MVSRPLESSSSDNLGLNRRDRKKLMTRRAIRSAALELFAERGYDDVTVAEITEAADVSAMTFYRHFGTKEAVITSVIISPEATKVLVDIAQMTDYKNLEAALRELFSYADAWGGQLADRVLLLRENPSLLGHIWQHSDQWVDCVLAETGTSIIDRTRARSLIGIFIECIAGWSERRDFPKNAGLKELLIQTIPATLAPHPS